MINVVLTTGTKIGNEEFHKINFIAKHYDGLVKCQFDTLAIKCEDNIFYVVLSDEHTMLIEKLDFHYEKTLKKH